VTPGTDGTDGMAGTAGADVAIVSRRDVLTRPALLAAGAGVFAVGVTAVLTRGGGPRPGVGTVVSVAAAVVLVLAFSGLTGWVMCAVARAAPGVLFAAAVGSYVVKVVVFGVAAALVAARPGFSATGFAVGGSVTLVSWLAAETAGVLRRPGLRSQTFGAPR